MSEALGSISAMQINKTKKFFFSGGVGILSLRNLLHMEVESQGDSRSWALMAHACNTSFSGGRDQED
jgi:hypothetical protein